MILRMVVLALALPVPAAMAAGSDPLAGSETRWFDSVGPFGGNTLAAQSVTGFRAVLLRNRAAATDLRIERIRVVLD